MPVEVELSGIGELDCTASLIHCYRAHVVIIHRPEMIQKYSTMLFSSRAL